VRRVSTKEGLVLIASHQRPHKKWKFVVPPVPKLPPRLQSVSAWLQFVLAAITAASALFVLGLGFISPDFVVKYRNVGYVPIAALNQQLGLSFDSIFGVGGNRLLEVEIDNNSTTTIAKDTTLTIDHLIEKFKFVVDAHGNVIRQYDLVQVGNMQVLRVPIGSLPPDARVTLFVSAKFTFPYGAEIYAESQPFGRSRSYALGETFGVRLFVANNLEWITVFILVTVSGALFSKYWRVQ
jgi:hypothetical protein